MPRKLIDVESDAMELPLEERALLAEHLLATLDPGVDVDAEESWIAEAEQRYVQYLAGAEKGRPAEQVFEDAKHRLR